MRDNNQNPKIMTNSKWLKQAKENQLELYKNYSLEELKEQLEKIKEIQEMDFFKDAISSLPKQFSFMCVRLLEELIEKKK